MRRALLLPLLLLPALAHAWGFDGHRRLASLLQDPLPADLCLRQWYASKQTATLQDRACDPDRWRATDVNEAPRHFLDVDWATPASSYPRDFAACQLSMGAYAQKNGLVPWRVEELFGQLIAAFRAKDVAKILETTFVLSHYVTDSFSVLHDTKNSDPNNGLHQRWESDMLGSAANLNGVTALAKSSYGAPGLADPRNNIFDVVIVGNGLVNTLVAADSANTGDMPGFFSAVKDLTARRWGDALTVLASLVWTAWAEAGQPELPGFSTACSRAAPTTEIVLAGYPAPGGFSHPATGTADGGAWTLPVGDAGVPGAADGGAPAPGASPPGGCGCAGTPGVSALGLLALAAGALRRRHQPGTRGADLSSRRTSPRAGGWGFTARHH